MPAWDIVCLPAGVALTRDFWSGDLNSGTPVCVVSAKVVTAKVIHWGWFISGVCVASEAGELGNKERSMAKLISECMTTVSFLS